jgi:hypothetical protein
MPDRPSKPPHPLKPPKRPRDINQLAYAIVQEATGEASMPDAEEEPTIRAAAAALGRRGGLKGGIARAAALSPEKRKEIATKAAQARWKKE